MRKYRVNMEPNPIGDEWYVIDYKDGFFGFWYELCSCRSLEQAKKIIEIDKKNPQHEE